MKSVLFSFLFAILTLIGVETARADTVTYTFLGQGGTLGTNWTLVDPDGFLTVPSGNVINLVQTATDLILVDPMTGPTDFGPLTNISVFSPPIEPGYDGIQLGSSSFTLELLFIPQVDFTTPGTYELAILPELKNDLPADQGALTITVTPEPRSTAIMLFGLGLIVLLRKRKGDEQNTLFAGAGFGSPESDTDGRNHDRAVRRGVASDLGAEPCERGESE